jgi:alpha/beta superfamily hydrolase
MPSGKQVTIATPRGAAPGVFHQAEGALGAVVMVAGAVGGTAGPSRAYPALAERLIEAEIGALRLDYRDPTNMNACVYDLDAGLDWLRAMAFARFALIGWSFGGAVVMSSAVAHGDVVGVAALASQTAGTAAVGRLAPRSLLLLHGTADQVLPEWCSHYLYQEAGEPKRLVLYEGDGHEFSRSYAHVVQTLFEWAMGLLAPTSDAPVERSTSS